MSEDASAFVVAPIAEMMEMVLPNDANILGNILGGKVMHLIDICSAITATRHCHRPVVTASIDYLEFRHPVKVGELIVVKAALNRAFKTSMEIGAKVWSDNLLTGERRHTSSAYLTFVALDDAGKPVPVPAYEPVTAEEKRRWQNAAVRREHRLAIKARLLQRKGK
jgi:acyl-CoA hydrolase